VSDVVQKTKMPFMSGMGHMKIRHGYHLLFLAGCGQRLKLSFHTGRFKKTPLYSIVAIPRMPGIWVKHCILS
jgi:hypothetical protein